MKNMEDPAAHNTATSPHIPTALPKRCGQTVFTMFIFWSADVYLGFGLACHFYKYVL